jgi:hypothetical protein
MVVVAAAAAAAAVVGRGDFPHPKMAAVGWLVAGEVGACGQGVVAALVVL